MPDPLIRIEHLHKSYQTEAGLFPVLKDVNLAIGRGEFVAVMGPSGSGKSTFMNILGCLDQPTEGRYFLDGNDTATLNADRLAKLRNRTIGFVFQGFNLLPRARLLDNVALPLVYAGMDKAGRHARARQLLDQVGLGDYHNAYPNRISGGQQQRVAIARALANRPSLLLADEPTGNLDSQTSREIMELFTGLNREHGITVVLITHEHDVANWAQRLVQFRDGRVERDGALTRQNAEKVKHA
ncbi:MAG: ABC transporter ATP-binding protein [Burkholderiales bacterium]